jgi:uncharacterized protein
LRKDAVSETARNKELVKKYFDACNRADAREIANMYASDGVHIVLGNTLLSGTYSREEMYGVCSKLLEVFPEGLRFIVGKMVAEGDTVAVEFRSHGKHVSGATYNNRYACVMTFRDGLLAEAREYFDTEHATEVLFGGTKRATS